LASKSRENRKKSRKDGQKRGVDGRKPQRKRKVRVTGGDREPKGVREGEAEGKKTFT